MRRKGTVRDRSKDQWVQPDREVGTNLVQRDETGNVGIRGWIDASGTL